MLSATDLNIVILSVIMVSVFIHMFFVLSAISECHNAEYPFLSVVMLIVIMVSVFIQRFFVLIVVITECCYY